ncbi:Heat shock factor protein Short=HSF [Rhizoctonia solani AG-1 IB]|uniref:Heat shock factor protein Short=HSF n=1 Tax=Thanatephorus cucumeris (strain AG1-IB / isolate 7/3/14) TaxID=1108050 RepID=M5BXW9_THACB|nr:Heat shock factor protein Short=HSF [Rhizoctonia solani AG-1 IB]
MASSTDQLALTKANRAPTVSTSTRQAVPAFLNKLYNMVSNPETDELVRWSDEGDSFYIPSHERLSKELLPRSPIFSKAFSKTVPKQNSGSSKTLTFNVDSLTCCVLSLHSNHAIGPATTTNQSPGPLDMTVLSSSLSAIKKHQTSLSAELKSLQESNQHLWNEALAARDRHKKHQDTINKILKFLASVFGNGASGATGSGPGGSPNTGRDGRASPGALVPRKRPRLMIENGSADDDEDDEIHFANPSPAMSVQEDHEMSEGEPDKRSTN